MISSTSSGSSASSSCSSAWAMKLEGAGSTMIRRGKESERGCLRPPGARAPVESSSVTLIVIVCSPVCSYSVGAIDKVLVAWFNVMKLASGERYTSKERVRVSEGSGSEKPGM